MNLTRSLGILALIVTSGVVVTLYSQESKPETQTYTGQITKIDKKTKTITIKGPRGGLIPDGDNTPPRGRGGAGARGGRRARGGAGIPGARGADTRVFEDVEIKVVWTDTTEVESMDGKLTLTDLQIGDYVLIDTIKDGKKTLAVKIKRTTTGGNL